MIRLITVAMGNPIFRMPEVVNDMMKELELEGTKKGGCGGANIRLSTVRAYKVFYYDYYGLGWWFFLENQKHIS